MKTKPRYHRLLTTAAFGAGLLLAALPASAQTIFNGDNTVTFVEETWNDGFRVAFGENQDGTLTINGSAITSNNARLADSDGSGTNNLAELNIVNFSALEFMSDGEYTHFGFDGTATVNVEPDSLLRTRRGSVGTLSGASGTVNLDGANSVWNHSVWAVEVGPGGTGEVNVLNGAQISLAQSFVIGGQMFGEIEEAGGTGILNVSGSGSEINFSNSSGFSRLAIGSGGTGTANISDGAVVNVTGNADAYDLWVGRRAGGSGTLNINSGGVVNADGILRIASVSSDSSTATIDGAGSQLNVEQWGFVGNTGATEGTVGTLTVTNGGAVSLGSFLRIGNQTGATGVVNVEGPDSIINLASYLQIGSDGTGIVNVTGGGRIAAESFLHVGENGNGTLSILDGGTVEVASRPDTTFGAFIGRADGSSGTVDVAGSGSELIATHSLFLGADPDGEASGGNGTLIVRDSAQVTAGSSLVARGDSSILFDGGSIVVESGSSFDDNSSLTGTGSLHSDLNISSNALIQGSGAGIEVTGALSGTGTVENISVDGVNSVASLGALTLNNVSFSSGAGINIVLDDLGAQDLISFDGQTSFNGTSLVVSFDGIDPSGTTSFALFNHTGTGDATYDFTSVTTPEGWSFEDGLLINEDPATSSPFADWTASFGLSGDGAAADADPDGDGFTNLQEFAFGTNPTEPTSSLVQVSSDGTTLTLRWNRSEDPGIEYVIQKSGDLVSWSPVDGAVPVVMDTPDVTPPAGYERVEWSVEIADEGARAFYQVVADIDPSLLP